MSSLTQVREKSGVMSIVLDKREEGQQQELMITAMGKDEAHKAKVLLEIHLKNQVYTYVYCMDVGKL